MKKFLLLFVCFIITIALYPQQGTVYNLYFHDHYYLNPAAAGSKGLTIFNIAAKESWLGFPENTPGNQTLSFQTRFNHLGFNTKYKRFNRSDKGSVGFGAMIYNDVAGPIRKTGVLTSYAYHIRLRQANMSFGFSPFFYQVFTDKKNVNLKSPDDPFYNQRDYFFTADVNFGFYVRSKDYFISVTANNLTESKIKITDNNFINDVNYREYAILTGYNIMMNKKLYLEPSFLVKSDENFETRLDLNMKWTYNNKFWAGFGYSVLSSLNAFVGMISDQFDFGYYFQMPGTDIIQYSLGSHEIVFSMKFGQEKLDRYNRYRR